MSFSVSPDEPQELGVVLKAGHIYLTEVGWVHSVNLRANVVQSDDTVASVCTRFAMTDKVCVCGLLMFGKVIRIVL